MTLITTTITTIRNQGSCALVDCVLDKTVTFEQIQTMIQNAFPSKSIDAIYTTKQEAVTFINFEEIKIAANTNHIQFVVQFIGSSDSMEEDGQGVEDLENGAFSVGPAVKKLLYLLKIELNKEQFESVNEFMNYLPDCNFKRRIIELKNSGIDAPRSNWLAKKMGIPEEQLQNEITFILKRFKNTKTCNNCSQALEATHYECLICPNYNLCQDCEGKNTDRCFHDASHIFAKLTKGNSVNFKEMAKMRRMLNRAHCHKEKLSGKKEKLSKEERQKRKAQRKQEKLARKTFHEEENGAKRCGKRCGEKLGGKTSRLSETNASIDILQQTVDRLQNIGLTH